jgi:uncharacterized protein (TIGR03067 family)
MAESLRPADLVGGYTIVSGEKYGKPEPPERVAGTIVRFTERDVKVVDKDSRELYVADYTLDATKAPCAIALTATVGPSSGDVAQGLIEKTGDTIRLIYALPGGAAPTDFHTKEKQLLFVMENKNK